MANPKYAAEPEREAQKRVVGDIKKALNPEGSFIPHKGMNKEVMKNRLKQEEAFLEEITPPRVETDQQRKYVVSRLKTLENAMVFGKPEAGIPTMPSKQEMWEPDAGNVGKHRSFEESWKSLNVDPETGNIVRVKGTKHRGAISEWKDLRRALYQDNESFDPDVANVERIRPDKKLDAMNQRSSTFSHPLANKTWAEYKAIVGGGQALSDVQMKIIAAEESGEPIEAPGYDKIYAQPKPKPGRLHVQEPKNAEPELSGIVKNICGYDATKNGQVCKRPVKEPGQRCSHHKDKDQ